jgi:hypothetical protein
MRGFSLACGLMAIVATTTLAAPGPFGFTVDVTLSPKAAARLAALHESITIAASYYGDPAPAAMRHADEVGQINLGRQEVEISGAGGAGVVDGSGVRRARLAWLAKPEPEVNVNVYSSRHSGPDNLLDCAFFQDLVSVAARHPVQLACKLIGEP